MKKIINQYKVKMLYTDWLLLTRGELRPEIGDKFVTKMTDEVSTINDEKDLNIVQRLIKMGAFAYVVELEFPTIKWEKHGDSYEGVVGNISLFEIELFAGEFILYVRGVPYERGYLVDLQKTANNLLYGLEN